VSKQACAKILRRNDDALAQEERSAPQRQRDSKGHTIKVFL
jgi:hypothetical protein